jgi:hypothetical protein
LTVAVTADVPFQPALIASVRKFAFVWLALIVKANALDLP